MKPFKLRVDWAVYAHYPDEPVVVELHVMDEEPVVLREFPDPPSAAGWARRWLEGRGFSFFCQIDWHQREDHTYVVLHAKPRLQ